MSAVTAMRFSVNVPDLSVQMTVTEPSDSTAGNRRMSAWRFNMRRAPKANAMVTMAARSSGTTSMEDSELYLLMVTTCPRTFKRQADAV
jgi:hypothetical protein